MKLDFDIEIVPIAVPETVTVLNEGIIEKSTLKVATLSVRHLEALAFQFRLDLFRAAGKRPPPTVRAPVNAK